MVAIQACLKRRPVSYHFKLNKNHPLAQWSYIKNTCLNLKAFYRQWRHCHLSEIFLSRTLKNRQISKQTFCFYRKRVLCQFFQCCFRLLTSELLLSIIDLPLTFVESAQIIMTRTNSYTFI